MKSYLIYQLVFLITATKCQNLYDTLHSEKLNLTYMYCDNCKTDYLKAAATCRACAASQADFPLDDDSIMTQVSANQFWRFLETSINFNKNGSELLCLKSLYSSNCTDSTFDLHIRNPLFLVSDLCFNSGKDGKTVSQSVCMTERNFICVPDKQHDHKNAYCETREYCAGEDPISVMMTGTCGLLLAVQFLDKNYLVGAGERIIKGKVTTIEENPWLVRFQAYYKDQGYSICSGAILSPYAVLTARHCVDAVQTDLWIYFGNAKVADQVKQQDNPKRAREITNAQLYLMTGQDLAIAVVPDALYNVTSSKVAPIRMPQSGGSVPDVDEWTRIAGWGAMCVSGELVNGKPCMHQMMSVDLMEISIRVVDTYSLWYNPTSPSTNCLYSNKMTKMTFCAGGPRDGGKDTCKGDSGSPLVCVGGDGLEYACGLASFGSDNCGDSPGGYVNLTTPEILSFLNESMADLQAKLDSGYFDRSDNETRKNLGLGIEATSFDRLLFVLIVLFEIW